MTFARCSPQPVKLFNMVPRIYLHQMFPISQCPLPCPPPSPWGGKVPGCGTDSLSVPPATLAGVPLTLSWVTPPPAASCLPVFFLPPTVCHSPSPSAAPCSWRRPASRRLPHSPFISLKKTKWKQKGFRFATFRFVVKKNWNKTDPPYL